MKRKYMFFVPFIFLIVLLLDLHESALHFKLMRLGMILVLAVLCGWLLDERRSVRDRTDVSKGIDQYGLFMDLSPDAVMIYSNDYVSYVNKQALVLLGAESKYQVLGKHMREFMLEEDVGAFMKQQQQMFLQLGQACYMEMKRKRLDGSIIDVEISMTPFLEEGRQSLLVFFRDISERKLAERKLTELNERLQILANIDGLTGIGNRRYFDELLEKEWKRALREQKPLSVIFFDVDQFKLYNDYYGHQAGDECLRAVAEALIASLYRPGDIGARYGGEEFVILLPNTDMDGAIHVAERTRRAIEALGVRHERSNVSSVVTSSFGVASMLPVSVASSAELVAAADQALYQAKRAGRNQIASYGDVHWQKADSGEQRAHTSSGLSLTMEGYLSSLHVYDEETWDHSNRIAYYAIHLAQELDLSLEDRQYVYMASLLHDIGKISIPKSILNKPSRLTKEEFEIIKQHPLLGYEKLIRHQAFKEKPQILTGVLHHHERWDGKGYPYNLKGEEIPLLARILGVVDAFDAMTSDRIYQRGLSMHEALQEIKRNRGTQFDPKVADLFIEICLHNEELFQSMRKEQSA